MDKATLVLFIRNYSIHYSSGLIEHSIRSNFDFGLNLNKATREAEEARKEHNPFFDRWE